MLTVDPRELGEAVVRIGEYRLSSGAHSPYYIDMRVVPSRPSLFRRVVDSLAKLVEEVDAVVGVATGGIPYAAAIAYSLGIPMGYVRREAKQHGAGRLVEGDVAGRVAIVDDVATTGESLVAAVEAVRRIGAEPVTAVVVVDREQCASKRLAEMGVELRRLFTARQLLEAVQAPRHVMEYVEASRCT